jgi:hypothetical protein
MKRLVRGIGTCGLFCIFLLQHASAQGTSATLNGTVVDQNGAVIPGALLQIKNVDTGLGQTATTNNSGAYSASQLPPGKYTVTVQKQGFKKTVQNNIVLTVSQIATLNVALQVGSVSEQVAVSADMEMINVTTAEISSVVDQTSVQSLPLNGRDPSSLVVLTTGTVSLFPPVSSNNNGSGLAGSRANPVGMPDETGASSEGGRQGSTYYVLDGAPNMDTYVGIAAPFPNADATQEFRVVSQNFDAQYGFSPDAVVSIQTRSGTNSFHGGAFEFLRNSDLNAANFFSHQVDPLRRNQFGGYVGGPIFKDKLFFFGNYQATRQSLTGTANAAYFPTQAMLNGDFSELLALPQPIILNQTLFPGNVMDPAQWSALVTASGAPGYAPYTIATTAVPLGQSPVLGPSFFTGPPQVTRFDEGTGRLDYTINNKQRIFLRSFSEFYQQAGASVKGNVSAFVDGVFSPYSNVALSHTWTINDTTVNTFTAFYTQATNDQLGKAEDKNGDAVCWDRYLTTIVELPGHCELDLLLITNGFNSFGSLSAGIRRSEWGYSEQLAKTIKNHSLSVGMDLHRDFSGVTTDYPVPPFVDFTGAYTGYGPADFLLGDTFLYIQGAGQLASVLGWSYGLYAQDQWRVSRKLTISAGMRWDPNIAGNVIGGRGAAFHPGQQSTKYPNAPLGAVFPGDTGVTSGLMPTTYKYFEPRVGITWQPGFAPHTAIRAGFGLFNGPLYYTEYEHSADIAPFAPTFELLGIPNPIAISNPWAGFPGGNPFPPFASLSQKPPANSTFLTPLSMPEVFDNNYRSPMTQSWNLSLEQELGKRFSLHLAYVGSESYHQTLVNDVNAGVNNVRVYDPQEIGEVVSIQTVGTASYNSFQAAIDKQLTHGLTAHSNFTWSKNFDEDSTGDPSLAANKGELTNPFNIRFNRAISSLNVPFISTTYFTYASPSLKSHGEFLSSLLGSWGLNMIYTLQSGLPFGVNAGGSQNNSGSLQDLDWADSVLGASPKVHKGTRAQWLAQYINPAAFQNNAIGTFGDSRRNSFRQPHLNTADTGITKDWHIQERYGLQFRWEMFNTFNHTSFSFGSPQVGAPNFGQITSVGAIPPRVMQGALKLSF